ncbi:transposase, partial [Paenibacillus sp. S150]|uniref:transposase n=1 Tax=Paenibacillus sp. S150 TaxID=2749826 RepID=UPI001C5A043C
AGPFLEQAFELLGEQKVKYARFDKGFGGEDFYALLEKQKIGYVGKIKWTKRLAAEVAACRYWTRYVDEDWIIEGIALWYHATSWKKPRRVAVIRKAKVVQDDQACLLLDTDWQYEAMVTSLDWESIDLWRFYNQRCCMENYIKEAKRGFSIDKIATSSFDANELDLLI